MKSWTCPGSLPPPSSPYLNLVQAKQNAWLFCIKRLIERALEVKSIMLLGEVVYKMGQKHRLALPKKFREVMGDQLVITRGYEGCLVIVSEQEWLPLVAAVDQASFLDVNARASARFLLGGASQISLDGQGRFVVPDVLFAHADLNEEVVFVGLGKWVEVWDRAKWEVLQQQLAEQGSDIAQRLISSKEDSQA